MRVAVMGSGPSAAYAVQACIDKGIQLDVYSDRLPEHTPPGAFFLHWVPLSLRGIYPLERVWSIGLGTNKNYTERQWGRPIPSSFKSGLRIWTGYNSKLLWYVWHHTPVKMVSKLSDIDLLRYSDVYDWVFHTFSTQQAAISRRLIKCPASLRWTPSSYPVILYNGTTIGNWVRMTWGWDRLSFEYPTSAPRNHIYIRDIPPEVEPVTPSEYLAPNIIPTGRFAKWNRKHLSHHSYSMVTGILVNS